MKVEIKDIFPKSKHGYFAIFFIIIIAILNLYWIKNDNYPPDYDQSVYLEHSEFFYHNLTDFGVKSFFISFINSFKVKAPLISIFPIPFYFIFGNSLKAAYFSLFICTFLINYFLFKLTLLIKNKKTALLTIFIFNTFPIIIGLSRAFYVEYFLTTVILAWFYYLFKSNFLQNKKVILTLGIIAGIGMLLKVIFPLYIFAPTLYYFYLSYKKSKNKNSVIEYSVRVIFIGFIISAIWYIKNFVSIFKFLFTNGYGSIAQDYSEGSVFAISTLLKYWIKIIDQGLSFYYLLLFLLLFILFFTQKQKIFRNNTKNLFMVLWLVIPFLIFNFAVNKADRFLTPLYPALAILISVLFFQIIKKPNKQILFGLFILIIPLIQFIYITFNFLPKTQYTLFGFYLIKSNFIEIRRPNNAKWPHQEIVDLIYKDSIWDKNQINVNFISNHRVFNNYNLKYIATKNNYRNIYFDSLINYDENIESVINWINTSDYIIVRTNCEPGPEYLNNFSEELQNKLNNNELNFKNFKHYTLPDKSKVLIYKKYEND